MANVDIEYRCFVGGLAWATDSRSLEQAFSSYGKVLDSKIINDRETGRSRGFGFVTFGTEQAMRDAIKGMNGQNLDGRASPSTRPRPTTTEVGSRAEVEAEDLAENQEYLFSLGLAMRSC